VGIVGTEDMFRILFDVNIDPVLWLLGDKTTDIRTAPMLFPKSYERQYMFVSAPISTTGLTKMDAARLRDRAENEVKVSMERAVEIQTADPKRFLLDPLWEALEGGKKAAGNVEEHVDKMIESNTSNANDESSSGPEGTLRRRISTALKVFATQLDPEPLPQTQTVPVQ
jgi:hypothetical protein